MKKSRISGPFKAPSVFKYFLIQNGAFEAFCCNFKKVHESSIGDFLRVSSPLNFICFAFIWNNTPQGDFYWQKLHSAWIDVVASFKP